MKLVRHKTRAVFERHNIVARPTCGMRPRLDAHVEKAG